MTECLKKVNYFMRLCLKCTEAYRILNWQGKWGVLHTPRVLQLEKNAYIIAARSAPSWDPQNR